MLLRTVLFAGFAFAASHAAGAAELRMTVQKPHFTCEGHTGGLSDVAFHPGQATGAAPLPCCDGQLGCAQFLSTNTIIRPPHEWHG